MAIEKLETLVESVGRLREGDICIVRLLRKFRDQETAEIGISQIKRQFAEVGCKVVILDTEVTLEYPREVHVINNAIVPIAPI